ncbi:O-antigen polysaccharide polymerase Wzy [Pseudanabaena sp. PCC 6802]|uniref:O-antigen polysaccharide polymerase Wzy n=1 Tax=Pseudanabaena sp. PCC 6802 TaxID=118173 RepID=UPI001930CDB2|nr:O-antigen polysaccharide polymerase Wzy [Pseudanabaena sp. PCC 6802]
MTFDKAYLALGIVWLGFLPSIQYLFDRNRPPMPFFPLVGLFYASGFGLSIFASKASVSGRWSIARVSEESLMLTFIALALMNVAFYFSKYFLWRKVSPIRFPQNYPFSKLLNLLWMLLILSTALRYIPFLRTIPSLGQFVRGSIYVIFGMFYVLWARGHLPKFQSRLLLFVFVPLEVIPRLASGLLAEIMILCLFMMIVIWYERKRIPVILISVLAILYLGLAPAKAEYRAQTWNDAGADLNPIQKVQLFVNLAIEHHQKYTFNFDSRVQATPKTSVLDQAAERSAQIVVLSKVMEDTPRVIPYWNGKTYLPLLTSFIPRIVWPDKPELRVGNEFGKRYNYLNANDFTTSFNLPWIVEMYANFGYWGVIFGMSLAGIFLSLIEAKLNDSRMSALEFIVGCAASFSLVYQESNFALMIGGLIPLIVSMYILFRFFLPDRPLKFTK